MKICHIITGLGTGGAETMLLKIVKASSESPDEHVVISLMDEGSRGKSIKQFATLHCIGLGRGKISPTALIKLLSVVRKEKPDVIQGWMYHANIAAFFVAKLLRKPVFWNIRHSLSALHEEKRMTRVLIKVSALLSRYVAIVLNNSKKSIDQHQNIGFSHSNSKAISNGFDVSYFKPLDTQVAFVSSSSIKLPDESVVFCMVGRFDPLKNHIGFVHAIRNIMQSDDRVFCVMAGTGIDQSNSALMRAINEGGCSERFCLLGELSDVRSVYHQSDYLVLPSISEGFPNVVGEAMACGTPCIVTDVGDCADIVGNAGWVCQPGSQDELTSAIKLAVELPRHEYDAKCKEARARMVQKYSIEEVYRQYMKAYETYLGTV